MRLTHLEFVGTFKLGTGAETLARIFAGGVQLVALRLAVALLCDVEPQFCEAASSARLPRLRRFGFRVTATAESAAPPYDAGADTALFPAIAAFLRTHPALETLELGVESPLDHECLGYDASIMGVLPLLTKLRHLAIAMPRDASPGLFAWILPRTVKALILEGVPTGSSEAFLNVNALQSLHCLLFSDCEIQSMRPGLPSDLRFFGARGAEVDDVACYIDRSVPPSVRLLNINGRLFGVERRADGHLERLDEWPERRTMYHAGEWLEALGCKDALWDDFSPGSVY